MILLFQVILALSQNPSKIENSKYSDAKVYGTDFHVVFFFMLWFALIILNTVPVSTLCLFPGRPWNSHWSLSQHCPWRLPARHLDGPGKSGFLPETKKFPGNFHHS